MAVGHIRYSSSLVIVFFVFGFHLVNVFAVQFSTATKCDQYKYSVQHQFQRNFCIPCKICPMQAERKLHNYACKQKIPNYIPGQGHAWCTGLNDRSPWCKPLSVPYGRLNCTSDVDVYSTCKLLCNPGYAPGHSNWTYLECLDTLHWNISDDSLLTCIRMAVPDKPSVVSFGQRQEVKSGSEKTLSCVLSSDIVGRRRIFWYFKGQPLHNDPDLDTYVVHRTSITNEGEYHCQVEDRIGRSELSAGYFLKVENNNDTGSEKDWMLGFIIGFVATVIVILGALCICLKINSACSMWCITLCHRITKCQNHDEDELFASKLSSLESSLGGYNQANATSNEVIFEESKQSLMAEVDQKFKPAEAEYQLLTKKEILDAVNENCSDYSLISTVKCSEHDCGGDKATDNMYSDVDQNDLRSVLKNCHWMKELKTLLDQLSGRDEEKPTFHILGSYLGESPDEIANLEFNCQQRAASPTESYLRKMAEHGQGLSNLLNFLKKFKQTQLIAGTIENELSNKHHDSKS